MAIIADAIENDVTNQPGMADALQDTLQIPAALHGSASLAEPGFTLLRDAILHCLKAHRWTSMASPFGQE